MPLTVGDFVYAKPPPAKRGQPWAYGRVVSSPAPRSYLITTPDGQEMRRNRIHLHPAQPPPPTTPQEAPSSLPQIPPSTTLPVTAAPVTVPTAPLPTSSPVLTQPTSVAPTCSPPPVAHNTPLRRSTRFRRSPDRYGY